MENKLEVKTPLGTLCANVVNSPDYSEIYIYIKREDGNEIDLCSAATDNPDKIEVHVYTNPLVEEWTHKFDITRHQIEEVEFS